MAALVHLQQYHETTEVQLVGQIINLAMQNLAALAVQGPDSDGDAPLPYS